MNEQRRKDAVNYCDMIRPDGRCALMAALVTENDDRCKYYRDRLEECRYLRYFILKQPNKKLAKQKGIN